MTTTIPEFGKKLMKAYELTKEIEAIEIELDKYAGCPVAVHEEDGIRFGHILLIDVEHGEVRVEFGLRSATNYQLKFYKYHDFVTGKLVVEMP